MNEDELREALTARYKKQAEITHRAIDAHRRAVATVERAEKAEQKAVDEIVRVQADQRATKTALEALGWEVPHA